MKAWTWLEPRLLPLAAPLDRCLPEDGALRRAFDEMAFVRPWLKLYRLAYVTDLRDRYFDHIVRFLYRCPIKPGDVVVQVGASLGEESERFARAVGPSGRLIAVEPEPTNVEILRERFPKDRYPQVTIVPMGAWKKKGELEFLVGSHKEHRLADLSAENLTYEWWGVEDTLQPSRYRSSIKVPVDTIDSILASLAIDAVDLMSFETNGAELEGVQGLVAIASRTRHVIARGHVRRDGVPIVRAILADLAAKGFDVAVTSEEMAVARRPEVDGPVLRLRDILFSPADAPTFTSGSQ